MTDATAPDNTPTDADIHRKLVDLSGRWEALAMRMNNRSAQLERIAYAVGAGDFPLTEFSEVEALGRALQQAANDSRALLDEIQGITR